MGERGNRENGGHSGNRENGEIIENRENRENGKIWGRWACPFCVRLMG